MSVAVSKLTGKRNYFEDFEVGSKLRHARGTTIGEVENQLLTKLVLNTVTTGAMIRLGKAYGNLMVDLMAWSEKLKDRGERIVMEACGVDRARARAAIAEAQGSVKLAIVMVRRGVTRADAERLLEQAGGLGRKGAGDPPPVA